MKKLIALLIALFTLFLVSCGGEVIDTTATNDTPATEPSVLSYWSSSKHAAIEMKSRVLLAGQTGQLYYYSKADGESYPFCFNPLCQHTYQEKCPSALFNHQYSSQNQTYYNEYDNRVYFARGQQIYSTSFDASDLRLECALGEKGKIEDSASYASTDITNLSAYENYLFFIYKNATTGHAQIYRYDMKKRDLKEMTSATDEWVDTFSFADGYLYVTALEGDLTKYYTTDCDFSEKHYVKHGMPRLNDGKYFYYISHDELHAFDPITDEEKVIKMDDEIEEYAEMVAVRDGYVYFIPYYKTLTELFLNTICRVSMDGKVEKVFDLPGSRINGVNLVSDGVIIFLMQLNMTDEQGTYSGQASMFFIHCDVAEDGRFINPKPIGKQADNEQLKEYLANLGVSSGEQTTETTTAETTITETEATIVTEATTATVATTETTATEATTSPAIEVDVEEIKEHLEYMSSLPVIGNYQSTREIEFKNFYRYPSSFTHGDHWYVDNYRQNLDGSFRYNHYYYDQNKSKDWDFYIFDIAGCQGNVLRNVERLGYPATDYYAYGYKFGTDYDDDKVYTLSELRGTPETLCYGWHRYDVGEMYLLLLKNDDDIETNWKYNDLYSFSIYLKIEEIDGVYWVYSNIYASLSGMKCAVKITDEYENLMYKPGKDDDVIAYMEANGIENPTYDYKCELGAFIAEMMSK